MRERWIMGAELRWLSGWWNYGEDMAVWRCRCVVFGFLGFSSRLKCIICCRDLLNSKYLSFIYGVS